MAQSDDTDRGLDFQGFESKDCPSTPALSPHGIADLYRTSWQLYKDLENNASNRGQFKETAANARSHHMTLVKEIETLNKAGVRALVDGKDQGQMLQELHTLEHRVPELEYRNTCRDMLHEVDRKWSYATSPLFVVLPSDLDSWDDLDPSTHQFRLYFLCDTKREGGAFEGPPQPVHLSNHPGYDLHRPHDFFQIYGDYICRVLIMVKRGYISNSYNIPSLDSFDILQGDTDHVENGLSKDAIGPFVDKAIAYLHDLSLPACPSEIGLTRTQSAGIRAYLDVPDGDNAEGNLYRYINSEQCVFWKCQEHVCQHFKQECWENLKEFVNSHGGHADLQQATLSIELRSAIEADRFRELLQAVGRAFDISIKLCWKATLATLGDLCQTIAATRAAFLEIDGITLDIHPQDHLLHARNFFADRVARATNIALITLLNYPRPHEQCMYMEDCEVKLPFSLARSSYDWVAVQRAVVKFGHTVEGWDVTATTCKAAAEKVRSVLAGYGFLEVPAITVHYGTWDGVFVFDQGAFVELYSLNMNFPQVAMATGRLQAMASHILEEENNQVLYDLANMQKGLMDLSISTDGQNILDQLQHLTSLWSNTRISRRHTLLERIDHNYGHVVAEFVISGRNSSSTVRDSLESCEVDQQSLSILGPTQDDSVDYEFLQWDYDHFFSLPSDFYASILDTATRQHPSVLAMFTLDISFLSLSSLACVQNILRRSCLECLSMVCTMLNMDQYDAVGQVLGAVQWSTLKALVLSGDNIDQWIQLWPSYIDPKLLWLTIRGTGSTNQELSHASALFIHEVAYMSSLVEMQLKGVMFQEKRDLELFEDIDLLRTN